MILELGPDLEQLVQSRLSSGRYGTATDVVRDALRVLDEQDRLLMWQREEIRDAIRAGVESLARGERVDGDEFFDRLEAELDELERATQHES